MSNALKDLFQEQADAIRLGLGNIGGIAPNETPALIREIVSMIGTGGGGGGGTGSGLKFATGTFDTGTTGIYRQTITHGLGVMPDFVMVYVDVMLVPTTSAEVIEKYPLQCVWGLHSKFASKAGVAGYYNIIGIAPDNTSGFLDVKKTDLQIYCPDDATFEFGLSSGTKGLLYEDMTYSWVAISGMATGGGSSADVRYVTFRNEATGEEFVKPVAVGDDCVDVVAKGLWSTPTKESDVQYTYPFANAWSATVDGEADADILKNITEDKTVYAVFDIALRKYTITYYDEDGTTVLHTEQVEYGKTPPSYVPTKTGYIHGGWSPKVVAVTGDASYTTTSWIQSITVLAQKTFSLSTSTMYTSFSGTRITLNKGDKFVVEWNGKSYDTTMKYAKIATNTVSNPSAKYGIGNPHKYKGSSSMTVSSVTDGNTGSTLYNSGEPFWIECRNESSSATTLVVFAGGSTGSFTIKILKLA